MARTSASQSIAGQGILPVATIALAIAIFVLDTITDVETAVGVLYVSVVLIAAQFCRARGIVLVSLGCAALTVLSHFLSPGDPWTTTALLDEFIGLCAIGVTTILVVKNQSAEMGLRHRAQLLDLTHDAIFVRDPNSVIAYWNRGAEELYGWKREEAVGKVTHELLRTVFPEPLEKVMETARRTGRWEGELIHAKKDGTQVVVASRWSAQEDEQGRLVGALETNNDITERKRAEVTLRESEEQWRAVFENNPTMYFMVDAAGAILSVNPFGAEKLGYTVNELVGRPVLNIFYDADREAVWSKVADCFERLGQAMTWEFRMVRKDGRVLWVRETASAVLLKNRPVALIVCEDITERKRAVEELEQTQAELARITRLTTIGQLTASIAHEINQPLTGVITNAHTCLHWLEDEHVDLGKARTAAQRIVRDGQRASDVIGRTRALMTKSAPQTVEIDMNGVIDEVLALTETELRIRGVRRRTELAATLPPVLGDRVQLQQVMLNLVTNAIDAMASVTDRPRILVIGSRQELTGEALVFVRDHGTGIDPDTAEKMFSAFFTTKAHGIGMGLAISRAIIEAHGGRLWASPASPHGAVFQFTLPTQVPQIS